jgi:DsbC/DsbD-like thiol-disulfide interchange protein
MMRPAHDPVNTGFAGMLSVESVDPSKPVTLALDAGYTVCEEPCLPAPAKLRRLRIPHPAVWFDLPSSQFPERSYPACAKHPPAKRRRSSKIE